MAFMSKPCGKEDPVGATAGAYLARQAQPELCETPIPEVVTVPRHTKTGREGAA